MSDELRFINAFIGFCTSSGGTWPEPFVHYSYRITGIEKEIGTQVGVQPGKVVPELVCASNVTNHIFCLEAKSATLSVTQAQRYQAITESQLHNSGMVPTNLDLATLVHDVIYVARPQNAGAIAQSLGQNNVVLPVVSGDSSCFVLHSGHLLLPEFQTVFRNGISIERTHKWPTHYIQFGHNASNAQLAPPVIQHLVLFLLKGKQFTSPDVAEKAVPHWKYCGTDERNAFANRIHEILKLASIGELKPYFVADRTIKRIKPDRLRPWSVAFKSPMNPQTIQALRRDATSFVNRQQTGAPFKKHQPTLPGIP